MDQCPKMQGHEGGNQAGQHFVRFLQDMNVLLGDTPAAEGAEIEVSGCHNHASGDHQNAYCVKRQEDNTRHEIPHVGVTLSDW